MAGDEDGVADAGEDLTGSLVEVAGWLRACGAAGPGLVDDTTRELSAVFGVSCETARGVLLGGDAPPAGDES